MTAVGAQEIIFIMTPADWSLVVDVYGELMRMHDDRSVCSGPTHEETFTDLIRNELKSYKQLSQALSDFGKSCGSSVVHAVLCVAVSSL